MLSFTTGTSNAAEELDIKNAFFCAKRSTEQTLFKSKSCPQFTFHESADTESATGWAHGWETRHPYWNRRQAGAVGPTS